VVAYVSQFVVFAPFDGICQRRTADYQMPSLHCWQVFELPHLTQECVFVFLSCALLEAKQNYKFGMLGRTIFDWYC
jgi:hypothetical protein